MFCSLIEPAFCYLLFIYSLYTKYIMFCPNMYL